MRRRNTKFQIALAVIASAIAGLPDAFATGASQVNRAGMRVEAETVVQADALALGPLILDEAGKQQPPVPCDQPQFREFDFWVGEWDVTSGAKKIAESSIQKIIGSCVIFENYTDPRGFSGKSFNFYDSALKKWRQTWVDNGGNVSEYSGEYKDGAMRFEGEVHGRNGQRIPYKMIIYNLGVDRVRQYSENSVDGGKTWKMSYDFLYLRRK
jgi:hypothetical protein